MQGPDLCRCKIRFPSMFPERHSAEVLLGTLLKRQLDPPGRHKGASIGRAALTSVAEHEPALNGRPGARWMTTLTAGSLGARNRRGLACTTDLIPAFSHCARTG